MAPTKSQKKPTSKKVVIDCTQPVTDKVLDPASFEKFLWDKIKVKGKCPASKNDISIVREKTKLTVVFTDPNSSKRYIKYLTKKYLKKQQLKDYLRVVNSGKSSYQMVYYKLNSEGEKSEE